MLRLRTFRREWARNAPFLFHRNWFWTLVYYSAVYFGIQWGMSVVPAVHVAVPLVVALIGLGGAIELGRRTGRDIRYTYVREAYGASEHDQELGWLKHYGKPATSDVLFDYQKTGKGWVRIGKGMVTFYITSSRFSGTRIINRYH